MKRTPLLLTLTFLVIVVLGYFTYQEFFSAKKYTQWDFIPDQTVLVYEVGDCEACLSSIKESPMWNIYEKLLQRFPKNDSIGKLFDFLATPKAGQLISLHVTQKDDFDFLFYLPESQVGLSEGFSTLIKQQSSRIKRRELNAVSIFEIRIGEKVFSWTVLEGFWIGSYTPFLVEDVIRTYSSESKSEFLRNVSSVSQMPRIKNDAGNIFINHDRFFDWLAVFLNQRPAELNKFGQSSLLDIKQTTNSITVNGFSLAPDPKSFLSIYDNQTPVPGTMKQYISDRTLTAVVHGISDGTLLFEKLDISHSKNDLDSLGKLTDTNLQALYSDLGKEIAVCFLEGRTKNTTKVIGFSCADTKPWLNFLSRLSEVVEPEDTLFFEKYSTYEIKEIELRNLPGKLFAPITSGFERTYYTSLGSVILMSDELEELKYYLDDIDNEEVWGKSVSFNKFMELALLESNFSVFVNTQQVWSALDGQLSDKWRKFVHDNIETSNSVDFGAIQFSHLNESFYTSIVWSYLNEGSKRGPTISTDQRIIANINSKIERGPYIIRNHATKKDEIIVQDSLNVLYQLDAQGKVLWSIALNGPLLSDAYQVDYFKNGKLQLFFATRETLRIVDRLGHYVSPFPLKTKISNIESVRVVDYDKSKNYRFMITDKNGDVWLYDKEGNVLDGWNPRSVEEPLSTAANHHRIRGKDYMLAIRRDGWAYLMNRRGEDLKGFPLNLDSRPEGDYHLETGNNLATTYFVVVSRDGFRVKFNLEGKIISKETLVKPTIDTQFSLIEEMDGKGYVIKRYDNKRLSILNESLEEVVHNDFIGNANAQIQFYDFGSGRVFFVIGDIAQELFYVYDGRGTLLNRVPFDGKSLQLRLDEAGNPKIYLVSGNQLIIQSL